MATLTISNRTDYSVNYLKPDVMPLCGDTFKNNIRIFDAQTNELEMTGSHADYLHYPTTNIPAHTAASWCFSLDQIFPALKSNGTYYVEVWYPRPIICRGEAGWREPLEMDAIMLRIEE